ncbi:hypothetical protein LTR53_002837 [Teratosphaeriaceae sp. CCFEE 6253]|nr:hypothetical protein LTR53_002837 [Teratosphaeriaceae sp. CCFEE 6253]
MVHIDQVHGGAKGRKPQTTALTRTHQDFGEATRSMHDQSDQGVHRYAIVAFGANDKVLRSMPIHPRVKPTSGAALYIIDGRTGIDIGPATVEHDEEDPASIVGPSHLARATAAGQHSRPMLLALREALDCEESQGMTYRYNGDGDVEDLDSTSVPEMIDIGSFWMHEEDKVKAYLTNRIERLQQLSDKRISKQWIKSICPRKQANFPYSTKLREANLKGKDEIKVPGWWPAVEVCPFKEPDHVKKNQRNALMLHLLRLRPTPEELRVMNGENCEPHQMHKAESWTAFLREVAPWDGFLDDLDPTSAGRVEKRRQLLREIYEVAEKEEHYILTGRGMDEQHHYELETKSQKPVTGKRTRATPSVIPGQDTDAADSDTDSSATFRCKKALKSQRRESETTTHVRRSKAGDQKPTFTVRKGGLQTETPSPAPHEDTRMDFENTRVVGATKPTASAARARALATEPGLAFRDGPGWHISHHHPVRQDAMVTHAQPHVDYKHVHSTDKSSHTSFNSSSTEQAATANPYQMYTIDQPFYPGQQAHGFPSCHAQHQDQHQQPLQVYHDDRLPQPQIDTVPNTPTFTPTEYLYQAPIHTQAHTGHPLEPSQYTIPFAQHHAGAQVYPYTHHVEPQHVHPEPAIQQLTHGMAAIYPLHHAAHPDGLPLMNNVHDVPIDYPFAPYHYPG